MQVSCAVLHKVIGVHLRLYMIYGYVDGAKDINHMWYITRGESSVDIGHVAVVLVTRSGAKKHNWLVVVCAKLWLFWDKVCVYRMI